MVGPQISPSAQRHLDVLDNHYAQARQRALDRILKRQPLADRVIHVTKVIYAVVKSREQLFWVGKNEKGIDRLKAESAGINLIDLFSDNDNPTKAIRDLYPKHIFNPYYEIYESIVNEYPLDGEFANIATQNSIYQPFVHAYSELTEPSLLGTRLRNLRDTLNACIEQIRKAGNNTSEDNFTRVAVENYKSLCTLITRTLENRPTVNIAWFDLESAGSHLFSHDDICRARKKLLHYVQKKLPTNACCGYAILLQHDSRRGYYLQAFIFLDKNGNRSALELIDSILENWRYEQGPARYRLDGNLLGHENSASSQYVDALETVTFATQTDFYFRLKPPGKARRYFPSQPPKPPSNRITREKQGRQNPVKPSPQPITWRGIDFELEEAWINAPLLGAGS